MLNSKQITSLTKSINKNIAITETAKLSNGRITTTNFDAFNTYYIGGFLSDALISSENLKKVLKAMKNPKIEITDNIVEFSEGKKKFTEKNALDVNDFPKSGVDIESIEHLRTLNTAKLKSFSKFCGADDLSPALTGVNINEDRMAVTDGHILKWDNSINSEVDIIIPKSVIDLLTEDEYYLYGKDGDINFILESTDGIHTIEFKAVDERFPKIESVIPIHDTIAFKVDKKDFIKNIKDVMPFADKSNNSIKFVDDRIIAGDIHTGTKMELDFGNKGEKFAVNAKLLLLAVNELEEDYVELKSGANNRPLLINDNTLLMPLMWNE